MSNTPELLRQVVSATGEKLWVANYIWDPNALDWIAMTPASAPGGGGPVTIADGQDTAEGSRADVAWDGAAASTTVVAILKRVATLLAGGSGGGPATIADGADVAEGAKGDAAWDGAAASATGISIWKYLGQKIEAVRALLAGTLTVGLPTGASTAAKQDTGNASVASIDTKTPALGQALAAASVPVVMTAAQLATLTPPAAITGFALESGGHLAAIDTSTAKIPAQGQAVAAASMPVVLPASQITTLTPPAAITGFALETGGNLATLAAKDFATSAKQDALLAAAATSAKQDTELAAITTLDTDLKAELGTLERTPAAYTVLDRLYQLGLKLDKQQGTLQGVLATLAKPAAPPNRTTLLHR